MPANPFRRSLRMPGKRLVWNPTPKGIRYERVQHPNSGMVAFGKKSPTSAYRVYHKGKVVGVVCQVSDRVEARPGGREMKRVSYDIKWLPIARGRDFYTAGETNKGTRGEAAARLVEIAEMSREVR